MNAKMYLREIKKLDVLIRNKTEECSELMTRATSTTAPMGVERVQSSSNGDKLERNVVAFIALKKELEADIDKFVALKKEAMSLIDSLENANEIDLLYKRYIKYQAWDKIADEMNYSIQGVFKLHGIALQKIQKTLDKTENFGEK